MGNLSLLIYMYGDNKLLCSGQLSPTLTLLELGESIVKHVSGKKYKMDDTLEYLAIIISHFLENVRYSQIEYVKMSKQIAFKKNKEQLSGN